MGRSVGSWRMYASSAAAASTRRRIARSLTTTSVTTGVLFARIAASRYIVVAGRRRALQLQRQALRRRRLDCKRSGCSSCKCQHSGNNKNNLWPIASTNGEEHQHNGQERHNRDRLQHGSRCAHHQSLRRQRGRGLLLLPLLPTFRRRPSSNVGTMLGYRSMGDLLAPQTSWQWWARGRLPSLYPSWRSVCRRGAVGTSTCGILAHTSRLPSSESLAEAGASHTAPLEQRRRTSITSCLVGRATD